jgi:hypothetical protein
MNTIKAQTPLRDVLYAFSLAKAIPDVELLDDFVRRYPGYAAEITDFAVEIAIDAARGDVEVEESAPKISPAVSRAISRFQNRLFELRQNEGNDRANSITARSAAGNPFSALDREGFRRLAVQLDANVLFVTKLRDRLIDPRTISRGFQQRVADELSVPLDVIIAHFAGQAGVRTAQLYKSEQKPTAGTQQSFEEAIRSSGLTAEQQRTLLSM